MSGILFPDVPTVGACDATDLADLIQQSRRARARLAAQDEAADAHARALETADEEAITTVAMRLAARAVGGMPPSAMRRGSGASVAWRVATHPDHDGALWLGRDGLLLVSPRRRATPAVQDLVAAFGCLGVATVLLSGVTTMPVVPTLSIAVCAIVLTMAVVDRLPTRVRPWTPQHQDWPRAQVLAIVTAAEDAVANTTASVLRDADTTRDGANASLRPPTPDA